MACRGACSLWTDLRSGCTSPQPNPSLTASPASMAFTPATISFSGPAAGWPSAASWSAAAAMLSISPISPLHFLDHQQIPKLGQVDVVGTHQRTGSNSSANCTMARIASRALALV